MSPFGTRHRRDIAAATRSAWSGLGWVGRIAVIGILLSVAIDIALGVSIVATSRRHVLRSRTDLMQTVADDLARRGLIPEPGSSAEALARFDGEVRLRLLGGETIRVKLWAQDGTIVYSDSSALIGQSFPLSQAALTAFEGDSSYNIIDEPDPRHSETSVQSLIEYYIPVIEDGETAVVFEIEQRAESLQEDLGALRTSTWASVGIGLGVVILSMAALTLAGARSSDKRRRHAETLFGDLLKAQDDERKRIVGALHDDVGQPLYRLLYGLEGCRTRMDGPDEITAELERLEELVRGIDRTLRGELQSLHQPDLRAIGLRAGIERLVEVTRSETGLPIQLEMPNELPLPPVSEAVLYRAAQEALINVRKYASAELVVVRVQQEGHRVALEVTDDGAGVSEVEGLGLATTRERLEAIGGGLQMRRRKGGGTVFRAWISSESERPQ